MNIPNLNIDILDNDDVVGTYLLEPSDISNPNLREEVESVMKNNFRDRPYVLRWCLKPDLPYPMYGDSFLYMYFPWDQTMETILEQKETVERQRDVIRNQETVLEDLMFGVVRQGKERIPYRLDCGTTIQFNINMSKINVMVMCKTVDMIIPKEWDGDFVSVLEQIEALLVTHGFNRGFGPTPEINPIRI